MNSARLLEAQRSLTGSFTPEDETPQKLDRAELGAIGIYAEVTGERSFDRACRKWFGDARPLVQERHRREAQRCLLFASF